MSRRSSIWRCIASSAEAPMRDSQAIRLAKLLSEGTPRIRLRLDKVVLRVQGSLRAGLSLHVPESTTVIATMIAPIKFPAKVTASLEETVKGLLVRRARKTDWIGEGHGNKGRLR